MSVQPNTGLSRYISRANIYPRLSRDEEQSLCHRWLSHRDPQAREQLIKSNLRHVIAIAKRYTRYGIPLEDLISEGCVGIVHALTKFEPERGNRFVTYAAYWIRACILGHVVRSWSMVSTGSGLMRSRVFFRVRRERARIMNLVGDVEDTESMLAQRFGVAAEQMRDMLHRLDSRDESLDAKIFDNGSTTMIDTLVAPDCDVERAYCDSEDATRTREWVQNSLKSLDPRERYIIEHRLMQSPEDELSLAEIGRIFGISRERARQLEIRARSKIKKHIADLSQGGHQLHPAAA